jgi:hypothetical protein
VWCGLSVVRPSFCLCDTRATEPYRFFSKFARQRQKAEWELAAERHWSGLSAQWSLSVDTAPFKLNSMKIWPCLKKNRHCTAEGRSPVSVVEKMNQFVFCVELENAISMGAASVLLSGSYLELVCVFAAAHNYRTKNNGILGYLSSQ